MTNMAKDKYYLLDEEIKTGMAYVEDIPQIDPPYDDVWIDGVALDDGVPAPFEYYLMNDEEPLYESSIIKGQMRHYYSETPPLMSDEMLDILFSMGVDNIDTYEAILHVEGREKPLTNYKAVNIIGNVFALDDGRSESESLGMGDEMGAPKFFRKMKVAEEKVKGLLLFRPEERASQIIVHESIKQALRAIFKESEFTEV